MFSKIFRGKNLIISICISLIFLFMFVVPLQADKTDIIGIGMKNDLYTRAALNSPWLQVPNSGDVIGITIMNDGTILGIGMKNDLYTRAALNSPWLQVPNSGDVIGITIMNDGTILGIGMKNDLYTRATLNSPWVQVPNSGDVIGVTVMNDGAILGIGMKNDLYTRAALNSPWVQVPNSGDVIGVCAYKTVDSTGNYPYSLETQFESMPSINNKLAFNIPPGIDFGSFFPCKHLQGMARGTSAEGNPYFFLTKSGTPTGACSSDTVSPGELWIVQIGSRPLDREVLGSNRQQGEPPANDTLVSRVFLDDTSTDIRSNTWPGWRHPGGVQLGNSVLAVAIHSPSKPNMPMGGIMLIDLTEHESPIYLKTISGFGERELGGVNAVGVTQIPGGEHKGKYLFVVGGSKSPNLTFGISSGNDLRDPKLAINFYCDYPVPDGKKMLGESINLVKDTNREIYLISFSSNDELINEVPNWGNNYMWLFKISLISESQISVSFIAKWNISKNFGDYGDVNAAACAYTSPSGRLILYAACHSDYCQAFFWLAEAGCRDGYVKVGEFASR
jgi:uncharacterized protein YuzE